MLKNKKLFCLNDVFNISNILITYILIGWPTCYSDKINNYKAASYKYFSVSLGYANALTSKSNSTVWSIIKYCDDWHSTLVIQDFR